MAEAKIRTLDDPCCPICFKQFNRPRQLPCVHSFCEKCLQSHIAIETTKDENISYVKCPVCGNSTSYTIKDRPTSEWASTFPANTVLPSIKDGLDVACYSQGTSVPTEGQCLGCQEAMCQDCMRVQKKPKTSTTNTILSTEELFCNPENVMKFAEGFTCSVHDGRDIKYYCKDHRVLCCCTCIIQTHKMCSIMTILGEEFASVLQESKPCEIISYMELIENDVKNCIEMNMASVRNLEVQNKKLNIYITEARKKINAVLDKLEEQLMKEGNRICKEEIDKKLDDNQTFSSHIQAVRNSQYLLNAVDKHGSSLHKFLTVEKMKPHLSFYRNLIREKYNKDDTMTIEVELSSPLQSILSNSLSEMGKIVTVVKSNAHPPTSLHSTKSCCLFKKTLAIDPKGPRQSYRPNYTGATFIPGDRMMLADYNNSKCILLNSSYKFITSHTLKGNPWNVCALDDVEVAVSFGNKNEIQVLSVLCDVIRPIRTITTFFYCNGMAASGKGDMVVNSYCSGKASCWSLYMGGNLKISCPYESSNYNYIALNNRLTHIYIAVNEMDSLLCFDMYGRKQFAYSSSHLLSPRGVAVDRCDNIYVAGFHSSNIHQLSPLGSLLQIITEGIPPNPCAICIDRSRDILVIMNNLERRALNIYQLKQYLIGY